MPFSSIEAGAGCGIAVIIPVYNRCDVLKRTLETVVGQTQVPQTLVVVDDGSTDGSADVAEQWLSSAAPPFDWMVIRSPHQNQAAARQRGMLELGEEPFIAFLDSDDLWPEDFLERTLKALKKSPDAAAVSTDRIHQYSDGTIKMLRSAGLQIDAVTWIFVNDAGIASCSLFRTDAVRRAGKWNKEVETGEDFLLFLEIAKTGIWLHSPGHPVTFNRWVARENGQETNHSQRPSFKPIWAVQHEQAFSQFPFNSPYRSGTVMWAVSRKWRLAGYTFIKNGQLRRAIDAYRSSLSWDPWCLAVRLRMLHSWMLAFVKGELRLNQVETRKIARLPKIEKIYFINLDRDETRRRLIEDRISLSFPSVPCERIIGVPAESLTQYEQFFSGRLKEPFQLDGKVYPRPGTIGCFLAHRNALREASRFHIEHNKNGQSDDGAILVLEDDCVFDQSVLPAMEAAMHSYLPDDWNAIKHSLGGSNICDRINKGFNDISGARLRRWTYYYGAHFVIYRLAAVDDVLQRMESGIICDYDVWLRDNIDHVYSFAQHFHIKQSGLGGSNTNPKIQVENQTNRSSLAKLLTLVRQGTKKVTNRFLGRRQFN